ncbi:MAG: ribosome small subunit-dependent GTPase A [Bacteroidota bacterium]
MQGLVMKSTGSWYLVKTDNNLFLECRLKGKLRLEDRKTTNPVAVGDIVELQIDENGSHQIITILPRKNYIIRKSINLSKQAHIIASNLDQAILVATLVAPKTSLGFIDRFLVTAEAYGIAATIIFNKSDLLDKEMIELQNDIIQLYTQIGYKCYAISSFNSKDVDQIKNLLKNKTSLLSGHSGVGKTTLVNAIDNHLNLKTGHISSAHLKGMHTTTFAELFPLSFGGNIIDSPGIKELGLVEMKKEEICHYFPEIRALLNECKFNNCIHINEPNCAVLKALKEGKIAEKRYQSYLGILNGEEMDWKDWEIK